MTAVINTVLSIMNSHCKQWPIEALLMWVLHQRGSEALRVKVRGWQDESG